MYDELTINEQQKTDMHFCQILQEVRQGLAHHNLKSRVISTTSVEYQELQEATHSPVCLFSTKRACADFNNKLSKLLTELSPTDEVDETVGKYKRSKNTATALDRLNIT